MRNKFRLYCVGLLCAGLLLCGVGLGVGFAEFSTFTYAGERVPESAKEKVQSFSTALPEDGEVSFAYNAYTYPAPPTATLTPDETVPQGTVRFQVGYRTVGPEPALDGYADLVYLNVRHGRELPMVLACKDQLLADLRQRTIGTYLPMELTTASIFMNPADASRVVNGVSSDGALALFPY